MLYIRNYSIKVYQILYFSEHNTKQKKGWNKKISSQSCVIYFLKKSYKFKDENLYLYSRLDEEVRDLDDYVDILHDANNKTQSIYYLQGKLSSVITADDLLFEVDESILDLSHNENGSAFANNNEIC